MASQSLKQKMASRIAKAHRDVFLPRDFQAFAGEDQVLRALRQLVADGRLFRMGYGVYVRATVSSLSGRPMIDSPNGFAGAARQALTRLKVDWEPSDNERAYNEGRSTQIPVNPTVKIKGRFSRKLSDGRRELRLERSA
ncbi:DUF6088 family protein [Caulobacter segnis]|uniref:DUF6088 family protein n=1 Tax=Caulobacter segnis TaxID=88688 RepID=UPI00241047F7|nr:DUF6088 family protein [Caulobacter segnis]MDG2522964.1 DUF6088 family protein [Caulobacter segnis]